MAKRSQTGTATVPGNAGTSAVAGEASGVPPDPSAGGALHDVDWHGEAAEIAARHWRRTLWLVAVLMAIGFVVTFVPQFWAREWASMRFAGWPLPFYMGAQGSILVDILLIVIYALLQRVNDARYRNALHALRDAHRDSLGDGDGGLSGASTSATTSYTSPRASRSTSFRASMPPSPRAHPAPPSR